MKLRIVKLRGMNTNQWQYSRSLRFTSGKIDFYFELCQGEVWFHKILCLIMPIFINITPLEFRQIL